VSNLFGKSKLHPLNLLVGLLGLILIGLGVFLITQTFPIIAISIGTIIGGILLLLCVCCIPKCSHHLKLLCCILLIVLTLFLIITGILSIIFGPLPLLGLIVGLILIGLGIVAFLLGLLCLIFKLCDCNPFDAEEVA